MVKTSNKKKLFIYFSLTGNGDIVANEFKNKGFEIRKVISKYKYPKNKFMLMMVGGYKATFEKKDKLLDFNANISPYEKIVLASPVWNDRISAPINEVLSILDLKNKNIDFILYSASGTANTAKERIKNLFGIDAIDLKEPKKHKNELLKIKNI